VAKLEEFDRSALLDGASLRREICRVRQSSRPGSERKPIADDTWGLWRLQAGIKRRVLLMNQYQAAIVCYQAFYGFSGKNLNGRINFNSVAVEDLEELTNEWLEQVDHPRIREAIAFVQYVALTPDQIEEKQFTVARPYLRPSTSKILQARVKYYLASRSRPRCQRFTREIVCRRVLRPVK